MQYTIWSWPGHIPENQVWESGCELIDTARTSLALTGLENNIPESYRGRNLFDDTDKPEAVFGIIRPPKDDIPDFDPKMMRVAILTPKYRMDINWFLDGTRPPFKLCDGNLFDLVNDPDEIINRLIESLRMSAP